MEGREGAEMSAQGVRDAALRIAQESPWVWCFGVRWCFFCQLNHPIHEEDCPWLVLSRELSEEEG